MQGISVLILLATLSILAFWRMHPVMFMLLGGVSLIVACYMADIMNGGVTNNITVSYSLGLIVYGFVCIGFAFLTMFRGIKWMGGSDG